MVANTKKTLTDLASTENNIQIDPKALERRQKYLDKRKAMGKSSLNTVLGLQKLRLHDSSGQTNGHHVTVVHDEPGKIQEALEKGYSFIQKHDAIKVGDHATDYASNLGSFESAYVGTDENGKPTTGYFMKIPQAWYQEEEAQREERRAAVDRQLYGDEFERDLNRKNMYRKREECEYTILSRR